MKPCLWASNYCGRRGTKSLLAMVCYQGYEVRTTPTGVKPSRHLPAGAGVFYQFDNAMPNSLVLLGNDALVAANGCFQRSHS